MLPLSRIYMIKKDVMNYKCVNVGNIIVDYNGLNVGNIMFLYVLCQG